MVDHQKKCIFVHVPKTGGTSIERVLGGDLQGWDDDTHLWKQHCSIKQIKEIYNIDIDEYYKFTFVRNPWARAVSGYMSWITSGAILNHLPNPTLKDYLLIRNGFESVDHLNNSEGRADHFLTQHSFINIDGVDSLDFIGRFENLQDDFNEVCDNLKVPRQELPHANKVNYKHYTEYYDDETREIVECKYAKDIEYFKYKFGE